MKDCRILLIVLLFFSARVISQSNTVRVITFDFNDGTILEKNNIIGAKAIGTSLVKDRFGNENSALYLHGNANSYFNLGASRLLQPVNGSISIWVNLDRPIYAGIGSDANPLIHAKNGPQDDYNTAYNISYDYKSNRFFASSHKDSTDEVNIKSEQEVLFNTWYHLVFTFDSTEFAFYVNGKLQQVAPKRYGLHYLDGDTIVVGNSANKKNNRWTQGIVDDIQIFHYALSPKEVTALYEAPNPNKVKLFFINAAKYLSIVLMFVLIIIGIVIRNKRNLKKQKEQFELKNRINELEIKVIKNQMNPHFVSNCLAAIQELIYTENYKKAAQYIAKFSFFLRQVLNYSDKTYTTLAEELNLIHLNIELEQLRFKEQFEFKLHVDHDIDINEVLIPSLITQPFIENAIWHGLLPLENKRKAALTVSILKKNENIFIEIEDNGIGRKMVPGTGNSDSRGTKLVKDKLESINRLMKSNDYKMEIMDLTDANNNPVGTKVIIQLKNSME